MTEQLYRLVFRGDLVPGITPEQARANLQENFRLQPMSIERLFAGKLVVLKTNLDRSSAERYLAIFERSGFCCRIEPLPAPDLRSAPAEPPAAPAGAATTPHQDWLFLELPKLVAAGVLNAPTAERIRAHYGAQEPVRKAPLALIICATLGSLLVGMGIILLFAHNWHELSRPVRTALSFAPLLLGQALAGWAIARRPDSRAWQEGSAAFLLVAVGASIALVGQTYHISGDLPRFVLTWMLLGLPLVYLMRAASVTGLFWIGITAWAVINRFENAPADLYWLLVLLPAPFFAQLWRQGTRRLARAWLLWLLSLCLACALGFTMPRSSTALVASVYALLFSLYYLADRLWMGSARSIWGRPLRLLGCGGIVVLGLAFSFRQLWGELGLRVGFERFHLLLGLNPLTVLLLGNLALVGTLLWKRRSLCGLGFGLAGCVILVCQLAAPLLPPSAPAWLFSLYLLLLAIASLRAGFREGLLSKVNGGLGILSLLIVARFFDSRLPFTLKGAAFIGIGIGFLLTNLLIKRKEAVACR